jgi:hypothetical protein
MSICCVCNDALLCNSFFLPNWNVSTSTVFVLSYIIHSLSCVNCVNVLLNETFLYNCSRG